MADRRRKRGPGRPAGSESSDVRRRLLDAAREICIESGFDAATTKQIASRAGVNTAMINYYFESKEGLGLAMMRDAINPLAERIDAAANAIDHVTLEGFMRIYMQTVAANPWLPKLIVREVLPVNGRFREMFLRELTPRAAELLGRIVHREREAGSLRRDADPTLAMLSLIALSVFPFLAAPIVEPVLRIRLQDENTLQALIEHSVAVFQHGLGMEAVT